MKMLIRTALSTAVLAAACASCTTAPLPGKVPTVDLSGVRLVSYSGCDDMLAGLREQTAKNVSSWGLGGPIAFAVDAMARGAVEKSSSDAAPEHSTTNVHEAGVDEPDLVKTDGNRVITVSQGKLKIIDAVTKKVTASLTLIKDEQLRGMAGNLLIIGDRALVVFEGGA